MIHLQTKQSFLLGQPNLGSPEGIRTVSTETVIEKYLSNITEQKELCTNVLSF